MSTRVIITTYNQHVRLLPPEPWLLLAAIKSTQVEGADSVMKSTRTQSVQDRIISETHSSLLQRGGRGKGAAAPFPCTPIPRRTSSASLRTTSPGPSRLTKPNTSCTIITPASLRSDCCSPSLRNAVRLASGIDVHLHRNTHEVENFGVEM